MWQFLGVLGSFVLDAQNQIRAKNFEIMVHASSSPTAPPKYSESRFGAFKRGYSKRKIVVLVWGRGWVRDFFLFFFLKIYSFPFNNKLYAKLKAVEGLNTIVFIHRKFIRVNISRFLAARVRKSLSAREYIRIR